MVRLKTESSENFDNDREGWRCRNGATHQAPQDMGRCAVAAIEGGSEK